MRLVSLRKLILQCQSRDTRPASSVRGVAEQGWPASGWAWIVRSGFSSAASVFLPRICLNKTNESLLTASFKPPEEISANSSKNQHKHKEMQNIYQVLLGINCISTAQSIINRRVCYWRSGACFSLFSSLSFLVQRFKVVSSCEVSRKNPRHHLSKNKQVSSRLQAAMVER